VDQLLRVSLPYTTSSPGKARATDTAIDDFPAGPAGPGDTEIYDIAVFRRPWGNFDFGPVLIVPTGTRSGVGQGAWSAGPAFGANCTCGKWKIGAFSQNFFSFADSGKAPVSKTKLQPIIQLSLPGGWSIGTSDMNFTYDWIKGHFTNIPLGDQVIKRFVLAGQRMSLGLQAEYNFANTAASSAWTFRLILEIKV
jgi:hypothetical protein